MCKEMMFYSYSSIVKCIENGFEVFGSCFFINVMLKYRSFKELENEKTAYICTCNGGTSLGECQYICMLVCITMSVTSHLCISLLNDLDVLKIDCGISPWFS